MVEDIEQEVKQLLPNLPKTMEGTNLELSLYQGCWFATKLAPLHGLLSFQRFFQSRDREIIVASMPKCGTTWLKALIFSTVNRNRYTPFDTPLLTSNPHNLVPFLEFQLFNGKEIPDLTTIPSPRLFATHLPFSGLPESMKRSECPIVYISRNPFDSAVSQWHHYREMDTNFEMPMEEFFEMYFVGKTLAGPYWDHVLGYWKESLENPNKVLFLKYEDLKEDIVYNLKKIAEFIGYPFSEEEGRNGAMGEIAEMCSLMSLKNLDVNKNGRFASINGNNAFFRKGEVGKWVDYLSPSKKKHLEKIMEEKLRGSGLSFKLSI